MFWGFFASVCFEEAGDINMESQNNGSYGENDGLGLYFPVFGLNTEIYAANTDQKKTCIWTLFTQRRTECKSILAPTWIQSVNETKLIKRNSFFYTAKM